MEEVDSSSLLVRGVSGGGTCTCTCRFFLTTALRACRVGQVEDLIAADPNTILPASRLRQAKRPFGQHAVVLQLDQAVCMGADAHKQSHLLTGGGRPLRRRHDGSNRTGLD